MTLAFKSILLFARQRGGETGVKESVDHLLEILAPLDCTVHAEVETAGAFQLDDLPQLKFSELGQCDLLIVVGGDGSILQAAEAAVAHDVPVLGINRGRLGFLADVKPQAIDTQIPAIIKGEYKEEHRFLLCAAIESGAETEYNDIALNEVAILPGDVPSLTEFTIFIDDELMCKHRADGIIFATPTGSTAHALSGGGPILHPNLDAIVLVPIFSHTLSSRPIVIRGDSQIKVYINKENITSPKLSCDGKKRETIAPGQSILITKKQQLLRLIHPVEYDYFETLRSKLGWESLTQKGL